MNVKNNQINLRISEKEKNEIRIEAKRNGYTSIAQYIIDSSLNKRSIINSQQSIYYTITLNPSLDYVVDIDDKIGKELFQNKFQKTHWIDNKNLKLDVGGKGINCSLIMNEFGSKTIPVYFSNLFIKNFFEKKFFNLNIESIWLDFKGNSNVNLKINNFNENIQTEINVSPSAFDQQINRKLVNIIEKISYKDYFIFLGDYNDKNFLDIEEIFKITYLNKGNIVLDLANPLNLKFLKFKPFLVKASFREFQNALGKKINSQSILITEMIKLKSIGIKNFIVTLEDRGAILISENSNIYKSRIKKTDFISPHGAGDALIGAFISNYDNVEIFQGDGCPFILNLSKIPWSWVKKLRAMGLKMMRA